MLKTTATVAGACLNLLILYLIRRFSRKELGQYKNVLTIFATYDLYLCILHGITSPKGVVINNVLGVVTVGVWQGMSIDNDTFAHIQYSVSAYLGSFTVPFSLLNIHFLYRYWSVTRPEFIVRFSRKRFIFLISLYPLGQAFLWFALIMAMILTGGRPGRLDDLRSALFEQCHIRAGGDWLLMDYWYGRHLHLIILCVALSVMGADFIIAITLGALTYRELLFTKHVSLHLRSLQFKLLFAVSAQTLVPALCVVVPYSALTLLPLFRLPDPGFGSLSPPLVALFPGWDALVILCSMRDYRDGLRELVCGMGKGKTAQGAKTTVLIVSGIGQPSAQLSFVQ